MLFQLLLIWLLVVVAFVSNRVCFLQLKLFMMMLLIQEKITDIDRHPCNYLCTINNHTLIAIYGGPSFLARSLNQPKIGTVDMILK